MILFSYSERFCCMNYFKYFKHPVLLFHDGGPYHIETSPLIYSANQWTGFYMKGTSIMKELPHFRLMLFIEGVKMED